MTQDEIIEMAIQAGALFDGGKLWLMYSEDFVVFAKLVAAKQREFTYGELIQHLLSLKVLSEDGAFIAEIRARGEQA